MIRYGINNRNRGVAQSGRALRLGRRGREFKSHHPDQPFIFRSFQYLALTK